MRKLLSYFKAAIFARIRRFVVWGDTKFGSSDMKLTIEPRWENVLDGFADIDEMLVSELDYKLSKDKANIVGLFSIFWIELCAIPPIIFVILPSMVI